MPSDPNQLSTGGPTEKEDGQDGGQRSKPRRPFRRIVLFVIIGYFAACVMLALLQRRLIYFPFREPTITAATAGLPDGRVQAVRATTRDGLELAGWLMLFDTAAGAPESPVALESSNRLLVLYFSGNAANRRYRVPELQVFTRLGADVMIFDYRGYGENPGSPSEEGLAADAAAAWDYATTTLLVPSDRIVLFGESLGGGVATRLAAEQCQSGQPPAGLIVRSTFSSLSDVAAFHYPWLPVRMLLVDRFPSTERIGAVTSPILTLHGARDEIVPLRFGRKLHDAAPESSSTGVAKRFAELPGAGHNDILDVARREYRTAIDDFLNQISPR